MTTRLFESFCIYLGTFQTLKERVRENERSRKEEHLYITESDREHLRSFVKEAEEQKEFKDLVMNTALDLSQYNGWLNWEDSIKNFFRNSGCYINLFIGKNLNDKDLFESYCNQFQKQDYQIKLLALMEFVEFAEDSMDFGSFQIQRFSTSELKTILKNEINEIFYPDAFVDTSKLDTLSNYWFISFRAQKSQLLPGKRIYSWSVKKPIEEKYSGYTKPIEDILKCLFLYEWENTPYGFIFEVPLFLYAGESLIVSPSNVPDLSVLETTNVGALPHELVAVPVILFRLKTSETIQFKKFTQKTKDILDNLKINENNWKFLEIAQNYFIKATFPTGLEQLLWHFVVIEALLGDVKPNLTSRLASRLASILGRNENERKYIKKNFKELYKIRCNLVHGNPFDERVCVSHIYDIRNLARRSLVWFLYYLSYIHARIPDIRNPQNIPTREDILTLIDMERGRMARLDRLIETLPAEFPYIREWLE